MAQLAGRVGAKCRAVLAWHGAVLANRVRVFAYLPGKFPYKTTESIRNPYELICSHRLTGPCRRGGTWRTKG